MALMAKSLLDSILKGLGDNMGRVFNTVATLTASAISRSNRKKALRNIKRINEANRNLSHLGRITVDQVIPSFYQIGNICISGGEQEIRNKLIVQSVLQSASVGMPTVVLHEGNHRLENDLIHVCSSQPYFRVINCNYSFYDPIYRLNDDESAMMIVAASNPNYKIDAAGALYLRAMTALLRSRGVTPYLRMLASCPHNSIQSVIIQEEQAGRLTSDEASAIRNDINIGMASRANIEYFFSHLQAEANILAWKSNLSRSTSIQECIKAGGTIIIDIDSTNKKTQLSLITSEIERCLSKGYSCRVILDFTCASSHDRLASLLKNSSDDLCWTVSTADIGNGAGTAKDDISAWLALSHKAIVFAHSLHSAEQLSKEFGEYEHIEVTQAHAGNTSFGQFGLHFGVNNNVSTTSRREQIVKPEEITSLSQNEFYLLDNNTASLYKGEFV